MIGRERSRAIILDVFEDGALAIGGLVAAYDLPDPAVWDLMKAMDAIRRKALARLEEAGDAEGPMPWSGLEPHPAIEEFLARLRRS